MAQNSGMAPEFSDGMKKTLYGSSTAAANAKPAARRANVKIPTLKNPMPMTPKPSADVRPASRHQRGGFADRQRQK